MTLFKHHLTHLREEEAEEFITNSLCKNFPFLTEQIYYFKDSLNFKYLAQNEQIDWSYQLITDFKERWDWYSLDNNKAVYEIITLGLHFPDKIKLKECDCYLQQEFCEEGCYSYSKFFKQDFELQNIAPKYYAALLHGIDMELFLDDELEDYIENNNADSIVAIFDFFNPVYKFY